MSIPRAAMRVVACLFLAACALIAARRADAQFSPYPASSYPASSYPSNPYGAAQPAVGKPSAMANLVPAQFMPRADSNGVSWNLHAQSGNVQYANGSFQYAGMANINGSQINFQQAQMSKDGTEYFFSVTMPPGSMGQQQGLVYSRRVRISPKFPGIRWIDGVQNPGAQPINISVTLTSQFDNSQAAAVVSDLSTPHAGGTLGAKESGIFAWAQPGQNQSSGLFYLNSPDAKVKPTLAFQNNVQFGFGYALSIPPGKTVYIVHAVARYDGVPMPDAKTLAGYFAPYKSNKWLADVPADVRKAIVNRGRGSGSSGTEGPSNRLADLGVEPGPSDILAVGEQTRLAGTASCESLKVTTRFGAVDLNLADVAAIAVAQGATAAVAEPTATTPAGIPAGVFLRDGQVLFGTVEAPTLSFQPKTGGEIPLPVDRLDRLVLKATLQPSQGPRAPAFQASSFQAAADDAGVLVDLSSGDRLLVRVDGDERLGMLSSWGPLSVAWSDIRSLARDPEALGFRLQLVDGTRLFVLPDVDELSLPTKLFGTHAVSLREVVAVSTRLPAEESDLEPKGPTVVLAGDNVVAGRIDLPELTFRAQGQDLKIATTMVRALQADLEATGPRTFTAELWDGSTIAGRLVVGALPIRRGDWRFEAFVDDLAELHTTEPIVPESVRIETLRLIDDLGHEDFEKREAADRALAALGRLAVPQLREASDRTTDPEAKRRLSALLDEATK